MGSGVEIIMCIEKSCHNPVTIIWKYVKVLEKIKQTRELKTFAFWSGRRDSNTSLTSNYLEDTILFSKSVLKVY